MGRVLVGTSGYVYRDWKERFYAGVPARAWLSHYGRSFGTVELNGTFYRLATPGSAARWRTQAPPGFVFAAKGSRFLTHMKRLKEPEKGLSRYYASLEGLGPALEVILWQLPPQMDKADLPRLDAFLAAQPPGRRHAVEFRSEAWYTDEVCDLLDAHGAAFCEHDLVPARPPRLTGGFRYIRFHGSEPLKRKYHGRYGRERLEPWASELAGWDGDAYVYFNNDWRGAAIEDALELQRLVPGISELASRRYSLTR